MQKNKFLITAIIIVVLAAAGLVYYILRTTREMPGIPQEEYMTVKVFFNNNQMDPEFSCNKVFPAEREILKTQAVARAALTELLKGPTDTEKAQGFFTSINPEVKIQQLTIDPPTGGGVAIVDFDEQLELSLIHI